VSGLKKGQSCRTCFDEDMAYDCGEHGCSDMSDEITVEACQEKCKTATTCNSWTYSTATARCFLKGTTRDEATIIKSNGKVSGPKNGGQRCPPETTAAAASTGQSTEPSAE
jgi:hypothetical protein